MTIYFDSSAIVKLIKSETESASLAEYVRRAGNERHVTCALAQVEVIRAALSVDGDLVKRARRVLAGFEQLNVDAALIDSAAMLLPASLVRSLDAIHLAAALAAGPSLTALITYDQRMAEAASALGLGVEAPS